jgi:hypothetical protein
MAATVLSGTGNVTYTNNTGQNVRVVINYCSAALLGSTGSDTIVMSWGDGTSTSPINASVPIAIGKNLAYTNTIYSGSGQNMLDPTTQQRPALPTEIMLAPGKTFSINGYLSKPAQLGNLGSYNIVIIPEAG